MHKSTPQTQTQDVENRFPLPVMRSCIVASFCWIRNRSVISICATKCVLLFWWPPPHNHCCVCSLKCFGRCRTCLFVVWGAALSGNYLGCWCNRIFHIFLHRDPNADACCANKYIHTHNHTHIPLRWILWVCNVHGRCFRFLNAKRHNLPADTMFTRNMADLYVRFRLFGLRVDPAFRWNLVHSPSRHCIISTETIWQKIPSSAKKKEM